jgi:hypothetical protein
MTSKDGNGVVVLPAEIAGEVAAHKRARLRAERVAATTGTALVLVRNGRLIRIRPERPLVKSA